MLKFLKKSVDEDIKTLKFELFSALQLILKTRMQKDPNQAKIV